MYFGPLGSVYNICMGVGGQAFPSEHSGQRWAASQVPAGPRTSLSNKAPSPSAGGTWLSSFPELLSSRDYGLGSRAKKKEDSYERLL